MKDQKVWYNVWVKTLRERNRMMDKIMFWNIIDETYQKSDGAIDYQLQLITEELIQMSGEEILGFEKVLYETWFSAYRAELWDAANFIACGCSDSGFHAFRAWLITRGRTVFEAALENPESLVSVVTFDNRLNVIDGRLLSVPRKAYERKMKQDIPAKVYGPSPKLVGELSDEETIQSKFPLLIAHLGECD